MDETKNLDVFSPRVIHSRPLEIKANLTKGGARPMVMDKFYIVSPFISSGVFDSRSAPVHR
jgi:hypothetical protein